MIHSSIKIIYKQHRPLCHIFEEHFNNNNSCLKQFRQANLNSAHSQKGTFHCYLKAPKWSVIICQIKQMVMA